MSPAFCRHMPPSSGPECVRGVYFHVQRFVSSPPHKINVVPCLGQLGKLLNRPQRAPGKPVAVDVPEWSPIQVLIRHDIDYLLCCGRWGDCCVLKLGCSGDGGKEEA
jgi:hypothetical protein